MREIDATIVEPLAEEFSAWRLGGCPGYGFSDRFREKVKKAARGAGVPHGELYTAVHREAYRKIDAAGTC